MHSSITYYMESLSYFISRVLKIEVLALNHLPWLGLPCFQVPRQHIADQCRRQKQEIFGVSNINPPILHRLRLLGVLAVIHD